MLAWPFGPPTPGAFCSTPIGHGSHSMLGYSRRDCRSRGGGRPNGLELSCPAEAGRLPFILAHTGGPGRPPYAPARRVSFSELLGSLKTYPMD
jgi:hypothetical protein